MFSDFNKWVREKEEFTNHRFPELLFSPDGFKHLTDIEAGLLGAPEIKKMTFEQLCDIPIASIRSIPSQALAAIDLDELERFAVYLEEHYPDEPELLSRPVRDQTGKAVEHQFRGGVALVKEIVSSQRRRVFAKQRIQKIHDEPLEVLDGGVVRLSDVQHKLGFIMDDVGSSRFLQAVFEHIGLEVWRQTFNGMVLKEEHLLEYLNYIRKSPAPLPALTEIPALLSVRDYTSKYNVSQSKLVTMCRNGEVEHYVFGYMVKDIMNKTTHVPDNNPPNSF